MGSDTNTLHTVLYLKKIPPEHKQRKLP